MDELRFGVFLDFLFLCEAGCEVASAPQWLPGPTTVLLIPLGNATNPINNGEGQRPVLVRAECTAGRSHHPPGHSRPSLVPAHYPQGQEKGTDVTTLCWHVTVA